MLVAEGCRTGDAQGITRNAVIGSCYRRRDAAVVHTIDAAVAHIQRTRRDVTRSAAGGRRGVVAGIGAGQIDTAHRDGFAGAHVLAGRECRRAVDRQAIVGNTVIAGGQRRRRGAVIPLVHPRVSHGQAALRNDTIGARKCTGRQIVVARRRATQCQAAEAVALAAVCVLVAESAAATGRHHIAAHFVGNVDDRAAGGQRAVVGFRYASGRERGGQLGDGQISIRRLLAGEVRARAIGEVAHRYRIVADRTGGRCRRAQIKTAGGAKAVVVGVAVAAGVGQRQRAYRRIRGVVILGGGRHKISDRIAVNLARGISHLNQQRIDRRYRKGAVHGRDGIVGRRSAGRNGIGCTRRLAGRASDADG